MNKKTILPPAVALLALSVLLLQEYWPRPGVDSVGGASTADAPQQVHMFVCADNGTYSGQHELYYIRNAMVDVYAVAIDDCQSGYFGYLVKSSGERIPSLVVTTGIYAVSAAACAVSFMQDTRYVPVSIVYLGTAGISPTVGGWNPRARGGCGVLQSPQKNFLGSVCVTDGALLQECGICVEGKITTECSRPNCIMHNSSSHFGKCAYRHPTTLATAMRKAMDGKKFPDPPEMVQQGVTSFWDSHQAVEDPTPPTQPRLLDCVETSTSQILAGGRSDLLCREYSHALLPEIPFEEHTCVQAMEGFGFLHVMSRFPAVPIAIVRAGSNYDMYPMSVAGVAADGTPLWEQNESFMPESDYDLYTRASYRYAVLTSSTVVLNYYTGKPIVGVD